MQSQWTYSHAVISPLQNTFEPLWMRKNLANWLKNPSILREPQGMKTWEFFLWFQPLSCLPRPGIFFWLLFYFPFLVIQVLNFKLIPVAHQLNFCLAVSLEWATILSVIRAPDISSSSKLEETEPADIIPLSNCSFEVAQMWLWYPATSIESTNILRTIKYCRTTWHFEREASQLSYLVC